MKPPLSIWQLLTLLVLGLPTLYLLWVWPASPVRIPSHFGIGRIGGYTSRDHMWLLTSVLPIGTYLLLGALPRFDPRRRLAVDSRCLHKLTLLLGGRRAGLLQLIPSVAPRTAARPGDGGQYLLVLRLTRQLSHDRTTQLFFRHPHAVGVEERYRVIKNALASGPPAFRGGLGLAALAVVGPLAWFEPTLLFVVLSAVGLGYGYSYWLYHRVQAGLEAGPD